MGKQHEEPVIIDLMAALKKSVAEAKCGCRPSDTECGCCMRHKMVGDGCQFCQPKEAKQ